MTANIQPVALVIGVGPGLGGAVARRLASDGFQVAVARRDKAKAAALAEEVGGSAYSIDVADPTSLDAGIDAVERDLGPLHTVCWNVGGGVFGKLDDRRLRPRGQLPRRPAAGRVDIRARHPAPRRELVALDPTALKTRWLRALDAAEVFIATRPADQAGNAQRARYKVSPFSWRFVPSQ